MRNIDPLDIDLLLPQTQCGLCGYGGCMPYAEAIAFEQAPLSLCPPGGVNTLRALGQLLNEDIKSDENIVLAKQKPRAIVVIREYECIGCTKCIQACPVDAILGAGKQMHTVIEKDCTGCELCIPACPIDCIDIVLNPVNAPISSEESQQYRHAYEAHSKRQLQREKIKASTLMAKNSQEKQAYLQAVLLRGKQKVSKQQINTTPNNNDKAIIKSCDE